MKDKRNYIVLVLFLTSILLGACEKKPLNDLLEQHWKLEQVTILETKETKTCDRMFFSVTRMVTKIEEKQGSHDYGSFIARTDYQNNGQVLVLRDFRVGELTTDTGEPASIEQLKPFGIINPEITSFFIIELTHHSLILESDYARLKLTKF